MYPDEMVIKFHGGRFQSDLPDTMVVGRGGEIRLIEFKIVDGMTLPWAKCRLGQHLMMLGLEKRHVDVWYWVWSREASAFYAIPPNFICEGETFDFSLLSPRCPAQTPPRKST